MFVAVAGSPKFWKGRENFEDSTSPDKISPAGSTVIQKPGSMHLYKKIWRWLVNKVNYDENL